MAEWMERINLTDLWRQEGTTFEERRDAVVARIRQSQWYRRDDGLGDLADVVYRLEVSEDADEFDGNWDELYDLADADRVWIATVF